ncbi:two-component response regulator [Deferribacter desulfuricans SSM1]|uniref:Two-component response regulator n=1 Tax=Deferribacter desulfuricans (strain DSM 14783 / JCM 11476 / NBRC 101012 / SSM1) TaxID=639282 RepID=D3PAN4_DEFDS|nr:response regulator [Deferribacter desulfuricans]BAI79657.1 two-component response regulator [Deferribacter desulfuricans SSM1]
MEKNYKILVVDDEEHTRLGYAEVLKLDGYEVETAETGLEGLEKAKQSDFDVIVTDLRMPQMDGLTFIEKLREFNKDVRVVIITAFGTYKSYQKSKQLGVITYLNKPVRAKDLKDAITDVLAK